MDKIVRQTEPSKAESADHLSPGQIINERYQVLSTVGKGGMGVVYRVKNIRLDTEYALKTLDKGQISEITWRRFQQEAQAASKLDHPNLIRVHELDLLGGSQPYFVMDYVEGTTLSREIQSKGPLKVAEALPIFIQVCFGLAYAHQKGVIHRDLKPSNIMIVEAGGTKNVKIVDFGIAKLIRSEDGDIQGLTRTGEIFGSPLYMSPEQCLGLTVDKRSDIYSLGCLMFEALTGMPPFLGDTALATMMKHQSETPPTLKEATLGKEFPAELEGVLARLLMKEPARRYQNLLSVAQDLGRIQRGEEISRGAATQAIPPRVKQERTVPLPQVIVVAAATSLLSAIAATLLATNSHNQPAQSEPQKPQFTGFELLQKNGLPGERGDLSYYSRETKGGRAFSFPGYIGRYTMTDAKHTSGMLKGNIFLPKGYQLIVDIDISLARDPLILKCFRHDEVCELDLNESGICDASLYYLPLLKSIRQLRADNTDITDGALQFIGELPLLQSLRLVGTKITGDGLAKMRNLKNLHLLQAGPSENVTPLLDAVRTSTKLDTLILDHVELTDENYNQLARLRKLTWLGLGGCRVSASGLEKLSALPGLERLDVADCQGIKQMKGSLSKLKHLNELVLPKDAIHDKTFMAEIREALPACKFINEKEDSSEDFADVELEREKERRKKES